MTASPVKSSWVSVILCKSFHNIALPLRDVSVVHCFSSFLFPVQVSAEIAFPLHCYLLIFTIFAGSLRSTVAMRLHLLLIILCCGFSGTLAGRQLGLYWCKFFWSDGGAKSTFTVNFPNVASACPGSSVFAIVCLSLLTVWCSWLAPCHCCTAVVVQIQSSSFCPLPTTR